MTVYLRSDMMSVAVPESSGGCGAQHTRKVTRGVPDKMFPIDCPHCEGYLRGDSKPKILKHKIENGRVVAQERIPDASPMIGSTPETVPLTPDEERTNHVRQERGAQQIQLLQALAALRATGIDVPDDAMWLMERELPAEILRGTMVCAAGHDNPSGLKFCGECGISMAAKAAIGGSVKDEGEPAVDLSRLHVATLRKMCRDRKPPLPDKGSKDDLIARLAA